jgi:hypothetical protein
MSKEAVNATPVKEQASQEHASNAFESQGGLSMAPPAFQLKASAPIQKKDVFYGNQKENTWVEDKNEKTGAAITYDNKGDADTRLTYLKSLGEWENLEVKSRTTGTKTEYYVTMQGKRTLNNFIKLVKKVEAAYPGKSTDEIIDGLRALAPGYNTARWQSMLGKKALAVAIKPVKDPITGIEILTQEDIDALKAMIEHSNDQPADERGVLKDNGGDYLAMGHVLTGVTAGINRNKNTDLTKGFWESAGGMVGVGEYVDNLHASTISGDLGQSATIKNNESGVNSKTPMIGNGTEATTAELFGDVDGFNIGNQETGKASHASLSSLLSTYYGGVEKDEKKNRFETFNTGAKSDLKNQTTRFASNYTYQVNGKGGGLFSEIGTESGYAVDQFNNWTDGQMKSPSTTTATPGLGEKVLKPVSGINLVSDPGNYTGTLIGYLEGGAKVRTLDLGIGKDFNMVADVSKMGWTKIMVLEGADQGKIGWVSNTFLNAK